MISQARGAACGSHGSVHPGKRQQTFTRSDYSKQKAQKLLKPANNCLPPPSYLRMKKLIIAAAVLAGGMAVSQAGISVNIGFPLPGVVISHPVPYCPPPVVVVQPYCAPRVVAPGPVFVAPPFYAPRIVVRDYGYGHRDYRRGHGHYYGHGRGYGHR
jgi:hypothetical protein